MKFILTLLSLLITFAYSGAGGPPQEPSNFEEQDCSRRAREAPSWFKNYDWAKHTTEEQSLIDVLETNRTTLISALEPQSRFKITIDRKLKCYTRSIVSINFYNEQAGYLSFMGVPTLTIQCRTDERADCFTGGFLETRSNISQTPNQGSFDIIIDPKEKVLEIGQNKYPIDWIQFDVDEASESKERKLKILDTLKFI